MLQHSGTYYCNSARCHSLASVLSRQLGHSYPGLRAPSRSPPAFAGMILMRSEHLMGGQRVARSVQCRWGGGACPVLPAGNVVSHAGSEASPLGFLPRDPNDCLRQLGRAEYEKSKPGISQNLTSPNGNPCKSAECENAGWALASKLINNLGHRRMIRKTHPWLLVRLLAATCS